MKRDRDFPKDFLWGASTASHQVEGGTHNQWSVWEKAHAEHSAATAENLLGWLPSWPRIAEQATDPANYISANGVEHFTRYKEDFDLLTSLNLNAFRFGIEWSRVEPKEGEWDPAALQHYHDYIAELKQRHIEPVMTLWHWTEPVWFSEKGAFAKRTNLRYFDRYVQKMVEEFGGEVSYILVLNEPNVYAAISYGTTFWPPETKSFITCVRVFYNLSVAHCRAYKIIKTAKPNVQVGVALAVATSRPASPHNPISRIMAKFRMYVWNWWFLNRIKRHQDFIGANFYVTEYVDWLGRIRNPKTPVNDLGWYMEPRGISEVLQQIEKRYHLPVIVTENGAADNRDEYRQWWIEETLEALREARRAGVQLFGYLHWSLLDNFEWAYGWWPEFGLVHVDRKTMKRTIRPSARWFADQISERPKSVK